MRRLSFVCALSLTLPVALAFAGIRLHAQPPSKGSTAKTWTFHTERMQLNHGLCDNNRHALQLRNTNCISVEV